MANEVQVFSSVGSAYAGFVAFATSVLDFRTSVPADYGDLEVVDIFGQRALKIPTPFGGDEIFLITDMPAGSTIASADLVLQTGIQAQIGYLANGSNGLGALSSTVTDWIFKGKKTIIETLSEGSVIEQISHTKGLASASVVSGLYVMMIDGRSRFLTTQDTYHLFDASVVSATAFIAPDGIETAAGMPLAGPAQLGKITEAAEAIADIDVNVSLNHGQSIFSVRGRMLT
jgi:hypothetical protein